MYEYRKLSPEQKAEVIQRRRDRGHPLHSPPHQVRHEHLYLVSAACYEHQMLMLVEQRRIDFLDLVFEAFKNAEIEIRAWVILPNHYHLLVELEDFKKLGATLRKVHGPAARRWNTEDETAGRRVWFNYSDRAIRSESHHYTTLNYIHYNPVKHGWIKSPYDWSESSVHRYLEQYGREWLRDLWLRYPVLEYGHGWDDK